MVAYRSPDLSLAGLFPAPPLTNSPVIHPMAFALAMLLASQADPSSERPLAFRPVASAGVLGLAGSALFPAPAPPTFSSRLAGP